MEQAHRAATGRAWWRDAVVYQIYVRSFGDASNDGGRGDGIGDLTGIIHRVPAIARLGVDAVWLTPCYPSPQHDHGYDVADYFDIDPAYGTLAVFDQLVATLHRHGLRALLDVVPNHCSSDHRWFREAVAAGRGSRERSRFYFRDGRGANGDLPPNNWQAMFGGPAWTRVFEPDGHLGQWYLHIFTPWQPDFDWSSPDVVRHFDEVLRFWFDRGVDGFRVDAVSHLGKAPGLPDAPPLPEGVRETAAGSHNPHALFRPEAHDVWRHWRSVVDAYEDEHPGRRLVTVGEAYTPRRPDRLLDYLRGDEFHQAFSFDLLLTPWIASMMRDTIDRTVSVLAEVDAAPTWTLNNHDCQRSVTRFGRADAHLPSSYTGSNLVYHDTPVDLELGTRRARAAILLLAALPGSMYLYAGEELGLPEVLDLPDAARTDPIFLRTGGREIGRDGCRVPLPWTTDPATGFGFSAHPARPWLPQSADWGGRSFEAQTDDPHSMLSLYREVLLLRRTLIDPESSLAWMLEGRDELVAFGRGDLQVVLNTSAVAVDISPVATGRRIAISSTGHHDPTSVPANSAVWLLPIDR